MRIIAGKHRGRRLAAPPGRALRPTADRAREALFNVLAHGLGESRLDWLDLEVADVFAGTGAFGLEALSRGAGHATFIDSDAAALDVVRRNARTLGEDEHITLVQCDACHPIPPPRGACGLVFLDPPYGGGLAAPALAALATSGWLGPGAIAVIELGAKEDFTPPAGFTALDARRHGAARLAFLRWED